MRRDKRLKEKKATHGQKGPGRFKRHVQSGLGNFLDIQMREKEKTMGSFIRGGRMIRVKRRKVNSLVS